MLKGQLTPSPRRKSTGCIGIKENTLKNIFLNFITTDFDRKLISQSKNMRQASKRINTYLYSNNDMIPFYNNNAVTNLIILILTDGKKYLNKRNIKYNIHFYLKLAEKASNENDHQTAVLIKIALDNYNIKRLKLKYNKGDTKIYNMLDKKYGGIYNNYKTHCLEFCDYYKLHSENCLEFNDNYIPSSIIIYLYSDFDTKKYNEKFKRLGKNPKEKIKYIENLSKYKKFIYNLYFGKKKIRLTNIYRNDPKKIDLIKDILKKQKYDNTLSRVLFILSTNAKSIETNNNLNMKKELSKYNRMLYNK